MLPKNNRFSFKDKLPKNVLNSPFFSIRYDKNNEGLRAAVVVSKKVDNRATIRNKIKRVILETVRNEISKDTNLNLVFYAKQAAAESKDLEDEIELVLKKLVASL